jgi:hypothetical protein
MTAITRARERFWTGHSPEWPVLATVALALVLGWALMTAITSRTTAFSDGTLSLRYPAYWSDGDDTDALLHASDLASGSTVTLRVLRELDPAAPVTLDDLLAQLAFQRARDLPMYRVLKTVPARVGGRSAVAAEYAYVEDPVASAYQSSMPVVVRGTSYILPYKGKAYVLSLETTATDYAVHARDFERIVQSVHLQ